MDKPTFSIVIPVAPDRECKVLDSIKFLNYPPKKFEVIVIRGKNPSLNRNLGFKKSKGKYIVFLDDDVIVPKDYLSIAEKFFAKHDDVDIVGGPQLTPPESSYFSRLCGYALSSRFGSWNLSKRYLIHKKSKFDAGEEYLTSANLICKRKVLEKTKFNPDLYPGEDPDFLNRAKRYFKLAYYPKLFVYHKRRETIKGFVKQIYRYGLARPQFSSFSYLLRKFYFFVPSAFLVYIVLLPYLAILNPLFVLPFVVYFCLCSVYAISIFKKEKKLSVFILFPIILFIMHVSYGAGFLVSFIKKFLNL